MSYSHPDIAYHEIHGPFDTIDEAQKHAENSLNDSDYPEFNVVWEMDDFGKQGDSGFIYIHKLEK